MMRDTLFSEAVEAQERLLLSGRDSKKMRQKLLEQLEAIDEDVTRQWIAVNSGKSASAACAIGAGVAAAVGAVPLALALGTASATGAVYTSFADMIADAIHKNQFTSMLAADKNVAIAHHKTAQDLQSTIKRLATKYHIPEDDVAKILFVWVNGGDEGRTQVENLKKNNDDLKILKKFLDAGGGILMFPTQTLKALGSSILVCDSVYSWCVTSPTQKSIRQAIDAVRESVVALEKYE